MSVRILRLELRVGGRTALYEVGIDLATGDVFRPKAGPLAAAPACEADCLEDDLESDDAPALRVEVLP